MFSSNTKEEELPKTGKWNFNIDKLNEDAKKIRKLDEEEEKIACTK